VAQAPAGSFYSRTDMDSRRDSDCFVRFSLNLVSQAPCGEDDSIPPRVRVSATKRPFFGDQNAINWLERALQSALFGP
jgi:hypothetical protein